MNDTASPDPENFEFTPQAPVPEPRGPLLDCCYLTGPTASGKTAIGLQIAEALGAEIISLDSMSVYRGMDIGTAKPTLTDRQRIPHHAVDVADPVEDFSLSEYVDLAHRAAAEIRARGRRVLFVGGTPLYLKAMLRGVYQGPPADWEFRRQVEAEIAQVGLEPLHQRLQQVDPLLANKLDPRDVRRIVRALEVYKLTGVPLSHQQRQFDQGRAATECTVFALSWERSELHHRIEQRVLAMFRDGLVEEVAELRQRYGSLGRTASQAVGYREALASLDGTHTLERAQLRVMARTRQFARRQETWFRSLSECRRVPVAEGEAAGDVAARILDQLNV